MVAKQFDEAIKAVNDGSVTECEENELPSSAVPYDSAKVNLYQMFSYGKNSRSICDTFICKNTFQFVCCVKQND